MSPSSGKLISSRDNPFFKELKRLVSNAAGARRSGLALLDGAHLVSACLDAGIPIRTLLVAERAQAVAEVMTLVDRIVPSVPVTITDALYRDLTNLAAPVGIAALIEIPRRSLKIGDGVEDVLALDGVQDAGNVGTLLRTAAAAGIRQVVLGERCASAWSLKVLRAAQGAHFCLQIEENVFLPGWLGSQTLPVIGADAHADTMLFDADLRGPHIWVFGSEGGGLSPEVRDALSTTIAIPLAADVESLNVAAAAAVCLFEAFRQRRS